MSLPLNRALVLPHGVEVIEQRTFVHALTGEQVPRREALYRVVVEGQQMFLTPAQLGAVVDAWLSLRGGS